MVTKTFAAVSNLDVLSQEVYAKINWGDDWELKQNVFATNVRFSAQPTLPTASLHYRYGLGHETDVDGPAVINKFTLPNLAYVQIRMTVRTLADPDVTEILYWHGVAGRLVDNMIGGDLDDGATPTPNPVAAGWQTIECVGLEWLLSRHYIRTGWGAGAFSSTPYLGRGLAFNGGGHPNRSLTLSFKPGETVPGGENEVYRFTDDARDWTTRDYWDSRAAVDHLLAYHIPAADGDIELGATYPVKWRISDDDAPATGSLLETNDILPPMETDGKKTLTLLNQIIARQRGYGFYFELDEPLHGDPTASTGDPLDSRVLLKVFTFTDSDIALPSGRVLKENPNVYDLEINRDRQAFIPRVTDAFAKYDRIRVRGGRAVFMFSTKPRTFYSGFANLPYGPGWTSAEDTDFKTGMTSETGYPAATEKQDRQEFARKWRARPEFDHVFRRFVVDNSWQHKIELTGPGDQFFPPVVDDLATPDTTAAGSVNHWELRAAPFVPVKPGFDYSAANKPDPATDWEWNVRQFLPPLLFFEHPNDAGKYIDSRLIGQLVDHATKKNAGAENEIPFNWSATVEPVDQAGAAFDVRVFGMERTVLDGSAFVADSSGNEFFGTWDIRDAYLTIAWTGDVFCEWVEDTAAAATADLLREKLISVGDRYQLHYIANETVVGVAPDGSLIQHSVSEYLIDDRPALKDIAALAKQWYGTDRNALLIPTSYLTADVRLGDFVGDLVEPTGNVAVNTVVTEFSIDYPVSRGDRVGRQNVRYQTSHAELDFMS